MFVHACRPIQAGKKHHTIVAAEHEFSIMYMPADDFVLFNGRCFITDWSPQAYSELIQYWPIASFAKADHMLRGVGRGYVTCT